MYVLGISALYHDAAAALIKDGEIIAAAQEERFTRKKHDPSIPVHAIDYCLKEGKIEPDDLEAVIYYDNPFLTMGRFVQNLQYAGKDSEDLLNFSLEALVNRKMWVHKMLREAIGRLGVRDQLYVTEWNLSVSVINFLHDSCYKGAWILRNTAASLGRIRVVFVKSSPL